MDTITPPFQSHGAMKNACIILILAILSVLPCEAGLSDVQITATKLKLDESTERKADVATTVREKQIAYEVTVQSKSFKPMENVDVKYMIFYEDSKIGVKGEDKEKSHRGAEHFATLEANRSVTFNTKPLVLTSETLDAGWYYPNGGNSRAKDRTTGVWIRAYQNGAIIGEYASPSTVTKRAWKD